jgi:lauroyl/myristoyl acyltransferase
MQLRVLYPQLTTEEREALAKKAGTHAGYLWQLSTNWRGKKPSINLMAKLAEADRRLKVTDMVEEFSEAKAT